MKKRRLRSLLLMALTGTLAITTLLGVGLGCSCNDKSEEPPTNYYIPEIDPVDPVASDWTETVVTAEDISLYGQKDYINEIQKVYAPTLSVSDSEVKIGIDGVQTWFFRKVDDNWWFDGIYTGGGQKVFRGSSGKVYRDKLVEDGNYFKVISNFSGGISGMVNNIEVVSNDGDLKAIKLTGQGFESTLRASKTTGFVEREIILKPNKDVVMTSGGDISFVLMGDVDEYNEYGYIMSRKSDDSRYTLPYSFPAIGGKLTRRSDQRRFTYITVVDYNNNSSCFRTARRATSGNDYFEQGVLTSEGTLYQNQRNYYRDSICIREDQNDSFYDIIYDARKEYGRLYDMDISSLITVNSNMNIYDWDDAIYGATYDIEDSRGRPLGDDTGTWGPYGYQNGGTESFGSMNMLKGMIRYAILTNDTELYEFAMKQLMVMITPDPVYGKCYIRPLNSEAAYSQYTSDYFFFLGCYGGSYNAVDSYAGAGAQNFGSFKYFSRVSEFGELALITDNDQLKEAYLKLMVMVKRLRGENFEQPVEWGLDGTPQLDFENGGSSGAEAMWANCMYIASFITEDENEKREYLEYMKKATDLANAQGFERSSSLRTAPKPESIGYIVRCNLALYNITRKLTYLNHAIKSARGIYFYYYHNTNPYTYFQTVGYGYACAHERWEAFMEMVESLELLTPILQYVDDPYIYELYMTLRESALSTLPINGYPEGVLGGHSDWLDALYVPFEQPTSVLGDNGLADGGASSYLRHSKELYGMGEMYLGALMYSTMGEAVDKDVLVLNYTTSWLMCSRRYNAYKLYNFGATGDKVIYFPNYESGNYKLTANGVVIGVYTSEQLANGISIRLEKEVPVKLILTITGSDLTALESIGEAPAISISDKQSNSAKVTLTKTGAAFYMLMVSNGEEFVKYNTSIACSEDGVFHLGFNDSSKLYIKGYAFDKYGNKSKATATQTLTTNDVAIAFQEDFGYAIVNNGDKSVVWTGSVPNWNSYSTRSGSTPLLISDLNSFKNYAQDNSKYRDPTGYMGIYKPTYVGYDLDVFYRDGIRVNLTEFPLFDFYPFCKNVGSTFTLQIEINGTQKNLLDKVSSFDLPVYRFNIAEEFGVSGEQNIKVAFIVEGTNRGFAVEKFRFVKETAYNDKLDIIGSSVFGGDSNFERKSNILTISNKDGDISSATNIKLEKFNPSEYYQFEIVLVGVAEGTNMTFNLRNGATIVFTDSKMLDKNTVTFSVLDDGTKIATLTYQIANMNLSSNIQYTAEFSFRLYGLDMSNIKETNPEMGLENTAIKYIRLNSQVSTGENSVVYLKDKEYTMANGWGSNYAFASKETGLIYNYNNKVAYGSIYKEGIYLDLDETPVIKFTIDKVGGSCAWVLKCNDGHFAEDLELAKGTTSGTFTANLRDHFGRGGVVYLRLDFYIEMSADNSGNTGARFKSYEFLKGSTLYENVINGGYSTTITSEFTINTANTNYLTVDIAELTYGGTWMMYLVYNDVDYEVKTVYEEYYSNMYSRSKKGAFKYQISDILPVSGIANVKLKIVIGGEDTEIVINNLRIETSNETIVMQRPCEIR